MTKQEQQAVDSLLKAVQDLRQENIKFREDVKLTVDSINQKTEKKHTPIYLEQDILKITQQSIQDSIKSSLSGYGSPLLKLVAEVVNENTIELKEIISSSFKSVIRTEEFKKSIIDAFSHKVARTIISNNNGLFDKVSNELKQDSIFKAKMSLAVSNVVEQCLTERGSKP